MNITSKLVTTGFVALSSRSAFYFPDHPVLSKCVNAITNWLHILNKENQDKTITM